MQKPSQKVSWDLHTVHFIKYWVLLQQINFWQKFHLKNVAVFKFLLDTFWLTILFLLVLYSVILGRKINFNRKKEFLTWHNTQYT